MNFDTTKYKVWTWRNPLVLHWILNPGLAFNELVFGQRIPKITLVEKERGKSMAERSFVPCPHCNTLHSGLTWSAQNNTAFKNWFGLYCANCGKIIPCVRNLTSAIILVLTSPIWYWFKNRWKQKWLATQKEKFSKPLVLTPPNYVWWHLGLKYGFLMFVFMSAYYFLLLQEAFTWGRILANAITWTVGGLLFGLIMKKFIGNQAPYERKKERQEAK